MAPVLSQDLGVHISSMDYFFLYFLSFVILSTVIFVLFMCCGKKKIKPMRSIQLGKPPGEVRLETLNEPETFADENQYLAPLSLPSEEKSLSPSQGGSLQLQSTRSISENQSFNKSKKLVTIF